MIAVSQPDESQGIDPKWQKQTVQSVQDALLILNFATIPDQAAKVHQRYVALFATTKRAKMLSGRLDQEKLLVRQNLVAARDMLQNLFRKERQKKKR
ncbi:hypothetical protein K8942_02480 [Candidatus Peribacteria bacterium]|nr:MAG: hypothetical protein K8942_02480 [Candidatus Peribacteria bacterium]